RTAKRAVAGRGWAGIAAGLLAGVALVGHADRAHAADPVGAADASGASDADADADAVDGKASRDKQVPSGIRPGPVPASPLGTRFAEPLEGQRMRIRYQWRRTKSQGLLIADRDARPGHVRDDLFLDYAETPRALDVTTHTVEVAYAPHPRTTLILQVPFIVKELETLEASGDRRSDRTEGVGDISLGLVVPFIRRGRESSHVHVAFDVPNGSFRKRDQGRRLPYDSQIGNGTVDFEWGWTYRGERDWISWGGQAIGRHPLGKNGLDYREGSRFEASLWSGMRLFDGLSATVRAQWQKQNNLSGRDRGFDPISDPAENGKARGGTRFLLGPGLSFDLPGALRGQRIAVELAVPVYQNLDGPQLEQDWTLTTGWQWVY
ncbi:transporter, partial [Myxococcota bacterium]|nr:transporter [Myxococcota bacterium]